MEGDRSWPFRIFKQGTANPRSDFLQYRIGQHEKQPMQCQLLTSERVTLVDDLRQNPLGDVLPIEPGIRAALPPICWDGGPPHNS